MFENLQNKSNIPSVPPVEDMFSATEKGPEPAVRKIVPPVVPNKPPVFNELPPIVESIPEAPKGDGKKYAVLGAIILLFIGLGVGVYFAIPKIKNMLSAAKEKTEVKKEEPKAVEQKNNEAEKKVENTIVNEPSKTEESVVVQKNNCGDIVATHSASQDKTSAENNALECFGNAILDCQPATVNFIGEGAYRYSVDKNENNFCFISQEINNFSKKITCKFPLDVILNNKAYIKEKKLENSYYAIIALALQSSKIKDMKAGETINLECFGNDGRNNQAEASNSSTTPVPVIEKDNGLDSDQDGLTDKEEERLGTNKMLTDTDGDGLFDREEVIAYKTDPKNPDTDGDGFKDGDEIKKGYNPNGPGKLFEIKK